MKESLCVADAEGISCVQRKGKQPTLINLPAEKKSAGSQRSFSAVASCGIWILGVYSQKSSGFCGIFVWCLPLSPPI